jgi:hypothetical protein
MNLTEDDTDLIYSPLGDSRERGVRCMYHRPNDESAMTRNWNGVCTRHQHLLPLGHNGPPATRTLAP